jgi:hypothetical protein
MSVTSDLTFYVDYGGFGSHGEATEQAMATATGVIDAAHGIIEQASCQLAADDVAAVRIRFVAASEAQAEAISADARGAVGAGE